jgi:hypothetical protein
LRCLICRHLFAQKHRILPGAWGGTYEPANVARLCPNHHWAVHALMRLALRRAPLSALDRSIVAECLDEPRFGAFWTARILPVLRRRLSSRGQDIDPIFGDPAFAASRGLALPSPPSHRMLPGPGPRPALPEPRWAGTWREARRALSDADFRKFERAVSLGYVTCGREDRARRHVPHFYYYCRDVNVPFVRAMSFGKYAKVCLDPDTTDDPPGFRMDAAAVARIDALIEARWVARDSEATTGPAGFSAWGIPAAAAADFAAEVVAIARPFMVPAEVSDQFRARMFSNRTGSSRSSINPGSRS